MGVYQAHSGPNFLAWAEQVAPRTAEATIAGSSAAVDLQQRITSLASTKTQLAKEIHNLNKARDMYPLELQAAKVRGEMLDIQLKRAKVFNSAARLELQAKAAEIQLMDSIKNMEEQREAKETLRRVTDKYGSEVYAAIRNGDNERLGELFGDIENEENFMHLIGTPMDPKLLRRDMRQEDIDAQNSKWQLRIDAYNEAKFNMAQELKSLEKTRVALENVRGGATQQNVLSHGLGLERIGTDKSGIKHLDKVMQGFIQDKINSVNRSSLIAPEKDVRIRFLNRLGFHYQHPVKQALGFFPQLFSDTLAIPFKDRTREIISLSDNANIEILNFAKDIETARKAKDQVAQGKAQQELYDYLMQITDWTEVEKLNRVQTNMNRLRRRRREELTSELPPAVRPTAAPQVDISLPVREPVLTSRQLDRQGLVNAIRDFYPDLTEEQAASFIITGQEGSE